MTAERSQSTTSLSKYYHGSQVNGNGNGNGPVGEEELRDPKLDFCNAFWGQGDKGYEVVMARLRGAGRTVDELRSFWKERAAIEEDYAKRLSKLSKTPLGKDEIGDLAGALQNVLAETSAQASYHQTLSSELRQSVEQPTAEFGTRLSNLKKGLQASVEKSWRNKGLQEGHVIKAKDRYESDCLKLNSYTANASLSQGKELEKIQSKLERVRQTIGANEQDFRQFVQVLQGTNSKWEGEWKSFCDHVQDLEEDRLALTKDIVWAYANAVSQVCVEDDSSCERIREKLEVFEPANDMIAFVKGWGTGDSIPDPPKFVNYSAGESYPVHPTSHVANFRRLSSKPPMPASTRQNETSAEQETNEYSYEAAKPEMVNGYAEGMNKLRLSDEPLSKSPEVETQSKAPFGGVALPGMAAPATPKQDLPERRSSMPPPPVPPAMAMPEPRVPSRQANRDVTSDSDPMAKALADLRRDPPPSGSIRRNPSHRRPESAASNKSNTVPIKSPPSPGPQSNRFSQQQASQTMSSTQSRQSVDMTLSPPAAGHTAAQLQKSMDDFHRQSYRGADKRESVNYSNYADDVVGAHPSSRPSTPSGAPRAPSPAMMQAPAQPPSPVADHVLSQYHQAFPGERSRSRAGSVASRSRAGSVNEPPKQEQPPASPSAAAAEGFAGIGAGGKRSPSPQPPAFRSPSPSPVVSHGNLGPQNMGISLDEKGGVAHDSMAEQYRRQYQQQQQQLQQQQKSSTPLQTSQYGAQTQQQQQPQQWQSQAAQGFSQPGQYGGHAASPSTGSGFNAQQRPTSGYGAPQQPYQPPQQQQQQYPQSPQQQYQQYNQTPTQTQPQSQHQPYPAYQPQQYQAPQPQTYPAQNGYSQQSQVYGQQQQQPQQPSHHQPQQPQQQQYQPQQQPYGRAPSPQPPTQQQQYGRAPSPQPQHQQQQQQQNYGYRAPSPQPQHQPQPASPYQHQPQRSPSPQPNRPPENTAPTGQWATNGQPVLFYVKALYDYTAESGAEFDFQAGDIIAVTSTPEDGWWSGELLDEARRVPGRTDFPSNFVCLF